jgi:hypothetical protein
MLYLLIPFFGHFNLGLSRVSRRNRFKRIVSTPEGVLFFYFSGYSQKVKLSRIRARPNHHCPSPVAGFREPARIC